MFGFGRHSSSVAFLNVVFKLSDDYSAVGWDERFFERLLGSITLGQDLKLVNFFAVGVNLDHVSHSGVAGRNLFILLAPIDVLFQQNLALVNQVQTNVLSALIGLDLLALLYFALYFYGGLALLVQHVLG